MHDRLPVEGTVLVLIFLFAQLCTLLSVHGVTLVKRGLLHSDSERSRTGNEQRVSQIDRATRLMCCKQTKRSLCMINFQHPWQLLGSY